MFRQAIANPLCSNTSKRKIIKKKSICKGIIIRLKYRTAVSCGLVNHHLMKMLLLNTSPFTRSNELSKESDSDVCD